MADWGKWMIGSEFGPAESPSEERAALSSSIVIVGDAALVWTTDAAGHLTYRSPLWDELAEGNADADRLLSGLAHPNDLEAVTSGFARAMETGTPWESQVRIGGPARGWRHHLVRLVPRHDDDHAVIGWVGTATDIEGHVRAERALRVLADASHRLNRSVVVDAYTGARRDECTPSTRGPSSSLPKSELEGVLRSALPLLGDGAILDVLGDDASAIERLRVTRRGLDPTRLDDARFDLASATVVYRGEPSVFLDVARENAATRSAWSKDPSRVNAAQLRFLDELGVSSYICVPLATRESRLGTLGFVKLEKGERFEDGDVELALDLAGRIAVSIDNARLHATTERRRVELEDANKSKDVFLATLSHELRTPLNAIVGWIEMMKKGAVDENDRPHAIDTIDRNARALTGLVADLLDVSRIVTGSLRIEQKAVSLPAIVDAAAVAARPQLESKGVVLVRAPESNVGLVRGDPGRLRQVVANLLSNAIKFSSPGGIVRISIHSDDESVRLVIADKGCGITREFLPHVFERFRQEQIGRSKGLGLGLAIVKHLVEEHGGNVSVASEGQGLGATFTVDLPVFHAAIGPDDAEAVSVPPASEPQLDGVHVLIVEDDPDGNELLSTILEDYGARVTSAMTAGDALEALEAEKPSVLISDIGLPDMDGMELIRIVRSKPHLKSIPAIALTAYASRDDASKVVAAGFNAHVAKPVEPPKLASVVLRLLR